MSRITWDRRATTNMPKCYVALLSRARKEKRKRRGKAPISNWPRQCRSHVACPSFTHHGNKTCQLGRLDAVRWVCFDKSALAIVAPCTPTWNRIPIMPVIAPPRPPSQYAGDDTTAPKETTYSDPSGAIFSMYITRALKFDDENVENWKGGADGILVFVRFRAAPTMKTALYLPP